MGNSAAIDPTGEINVYIKSGPSSSGSVSKSLFVTLHGPVESCAGQRRLHRGGARVLNRRAPGSMTLR